MAIIYYLVSYFVLNCDDGGRINLEFLEAGQMCL